MIRLCAPQFDAEDRRRVDEVLASGMLVQGAMVAEFEAALEQVLGVHVVACSSGTAALHLALLALDLSPGDEVIMPAFTWPSAAHAIVQVGATPVFVDIDPETLNLDPAGLAAALTERTRALLPIHQFGIPAPMTAVMRFAEQHGLRVIEDAACAIGTRCDGALAGTIGDMGCFSFHPRKVLTTGEGGAISTRDAALAERLRSLRNHGQNPDLGLARFTDAGLNYRMPELCAAIGISQARDLDAIVDRRRAIAARITAGLGGVLGVHVPAGVRDPAGNVQSYVIRLRQPELRDAFMKGCADHGVQTTIGTYAVVSQPVFMERGIKPGDYPHAVDAMHELVTLPVHPLMSDEDADRVASVVRTVTDDLRP